MFTVDICLYGGYFFSLFIGICSGQEIRLQGSNTSDSGRVEIFHNGRWGTVCDGKWDIDDANVVCRELGFPGANAALKGHNVPDGSGEVWLDGVECIGVERHLASCRHDGWGNKNCGHDRDAGVQCIIQSNPDNKKTTERTASSSGLPYKYKVAIIISSVIVVCIIILCIVAWRCKKRSRQPNEPTTPTAAMHDNELYEPAEAAEAVEAVNISYTVIFR